MYNKIQIHGYLGNDPELQILEGNDGPFAKVSFRVGVPRSRSDETDWFFCTMTGKENGRPAVIDKYFHKGSEILLEGRMESFRANTEEGRTFWTVKVTDFDFCGKKSNRNEETPEGFTPVDETFDLF